MTAYQNCEVSEVMPVTLPSGVAGAGYGFSIRSENKRPLVTLSFGTREDAEQARAEVANAVEKAWRSRRRVRRIAVRGVPRFPKVPLAKRRGRESFCASSRSTARRVSRRGRDLGFTRRRQCGPCDLNRLRNSLGDFVARLCGIVSCLNERENGLPTFVEDTKAKAQDQFSPRDFAHCAVLVDEARHVFVS